MSLWIRMIFSCIVDADFLDTESYMEPDNKKTRGDYLSLAELLIQFNSYMDKMIKKTIEEENTIVNQARQKYLLECPIQQQIEGRILSLTVPTGGGKTLSSMAFALEHAAEFGKERIIYVIPYTSIIEQNADVFERCLVRNRSLSTIPI